MIDSCTCNDGSVEVGYWHSAIALFLVIDQHGDNMMMMMMMMIIIIISWWLLDMLARVMMIAAVLMVIIMLIMVTVLVTVLVMICKSCGLNGCSAAIIGPADHAHSSRS